MAPWLFLSGIYLNVIQVKDRKTCITKGSLWGRFIPVSVPQRGLKVTVPMGTPAEFPDVRDPVA